MLDILKFGVNSRTDLPEDSFECFNRSPVIHYLSQLIRHRRDMFETREVN